jgi:lipid-A-disaccharide synthase
VYRTSPVTFFIGRLLVDVPFIGLVNFVAGKKVVPELVQHQLEAQPLEQILLQLLFDRSFADTMRSELSVIQEKLGSSGASHRVAEGIIALGEAA